MADRQESTSSRKQVRLMMLTLPRSNATVLSKCLSFVEDSLIVYELFIGSFYLGPERVFVEHPNSYLEDLVAAIVKNAPEDDLRGVTRGASQRGYQCVKEQFEAAYPDKSFIFGKDMAFVFTKREHFLPEGYRYMFLIRHPLKVFSSWKQVIAPMTEGKPLDELDSTHMPAGYGYKEMSDLMDYIRDERHQEAIVIIDADDLLGDPKGTLSALFKAVGLPFEEKLINWEAGDAVTMTWLASKLVKGAINAGQFYKKALDSTCFLKPRGLPDRASLPRDVLHCADASMPYYEKMYAQRLRPEQS